MIKDIVISFLAAALLVGWAAERIGADRAVACSLFLTAWVMLFILCISIEDGVDRLQSRRARIRQIKRLLERLKGGRGDGLS